jgi:arsenate reductase
MITLYGISNCDTIKKAKRWLEENQVAYQFHDYRKDGLDRAQLERFEAALGWQTLINQRGTTWRKLPASVRDNIDRPSALDAMLEQPAMIKRPVVETDDYFLVGFNAEGWAKRLNQG